MKSVVDQFRWFAVNAKRLLPCKLTPVAQFAAFTRMAAPLAVANIGEFLPLLAERATLASRWTTDHDLLQVAGLAYAENPYIELLAWALRPDTHPASALARQHTWIASLNLDPAPNIQEAELPVTQFFTGDGRPDLLLQYSNAVVVVEVKRLAGVLDQIGTA